MTDAVTLPDSDQPADPQPVLSSLPAGPWTVAFEGMDGSGKTTQANLLAQALKDDGRAVTRTRQPGDGPGLGPDGAALRSLLLDPDGDLTVEARHLLFAADNAQNVNRVVRPALKRGHIVVVDRGPGSALAYQGFGEELGTTRVGLSYGWATRWFWPSVTVEVVTARPADKPADERDFIERLPSDFHQRVRDGYDYLASAAARWLRVSAQADDTPEQVHQMVLAALAEAASAGWIADRPEDERSGERPWALMMEGREVAAAIR